MDRRDNYPRGVPFSINYPEIPLYAFLENSARKFPDRDAVVFYGNRITYSRLWDETKRLAHALEELGLGKSDRIGLLLPNVPQFVIAYYAVLIIGGVAVPVSPLNPTQEISRELGETEVDTVIVLDRLLDKLPEVRPRYVVVAEAAGYVPWHLRALSRLRDRGTAHPDGTLSFQELIQGPSLEVFPEVDPKEDLAVIMYTSGTTGQPKGVMLTHFNLVSNALQSYHWLRGWGFSAKPQLAGWPIVVCAVPFFHSYGLTVALNEGIQFGCTHVLLPEPDAEAIMKTVQNYRGTHLPVIPRFIKEILSHPRLRDYDLTSLTSCVSGGASIEPELIEGFIKVTGARFYQGYGLTEAGPTTHCTPIEGRSDPRSAGLAFPDTEARILDLQLGEVELPSGRKGELVVRGPQIMKGYWRDAEETARVLKDGWLYTGDICYQDEAGYLYIVGRKRDRIVAGGHTVWPTEVEETLKSHPFVEIAVTVGVPDPLRCTTDIEAFVTLKGAHDREGLEAELMDHCRKHLEYFQVPGRITVVESLPTTPIGEIDRQAVEAEVDKRVQELMSLSI
jgi:long-chain acyl-CoA synthetase